MFLRDIVNPYPPSGYGRFDLYAHFYLYAVRKLIADLNTGLLSTSTERYHYLTQWVTQVSFCSHTKVT
jgi:hypothetical protein